MLTKNDLGQIDKIVVRRTGEIVSKELKPLKADVAVLKSDVATIKGEITTVKGDVTDLKNDVATIKGEVTTMKGDLAKVRTDINVLVSFFDREYMDLRKRVDRIEEHLNLPPIAP
jgi:predicted  nucleic acid-binding Zn-ribbon protein